MSRAAPTLIQAVLLAELAAVAAWLGVLHAPPQLSLPAPGQAGWAALATLAWAVVCVAPPLLRHRRNNRHPAGDTVDAGAMLVVHASQTGFAETLAALTAGSVTRAGGRARLLPLARLDAAALAGPRRVLFIVSTSGEGDPPDSAHRFARDVMAASPDLGRLEYGLLALGDSSYRHFCGFGRQLDDWLRRHGATALFDRVEVDRADEGALRHWQHHLGTLLDARGLPDWQPPEYSSWILRGRRFTNPGSPGAAVYDLALVPAAGLPGWEPGDIAEIGPEHSAETVEAWLAATGVDGALTVPGPHGPQPLRRLLAASELPPPGPQPPAAELAARLRPLPHREYSIAATAGEGELRLLVRLVTDAAGRPGIGSGWLGLHAPLGASIRLRLRPNPGFRLADTAAPLILIGNGTGLAGLRAHLSQRVACGRRRNWLLYGERDPSCDLHYAEDIQRWQAQGFIEHLDLVFSRAQPGRRHVQHRLAECGEHLRRWIGDGATILVCGSLEGMASGVHATLLEILGDAGLEALIAAGRYRRDVY